MAAPSDAVATLTDEQGTLLAKLASIAEMIEGHRATIMMLDHERLQLQHKLRLTGYRAPAARDAT